MKSYLFTVSTPDGNLFRGEIEFLALRGVEGELAVMAGHAPFVTSLVPCEVRLELPDGTEKTGHTDGGLLTVTPQEVTLLSGLFTWAE